MSKPASAFAGAVGGGGKTIAWESMSASLTPQQLPTTFPTVSNVAAGITTRFVSLIPENVTRGTVTLERVRGGIYTLWNAVSLLGSGDRTNLVVPYTMQLVPVQDGTIALDSVLDGRNAADLESNRIVWRGNIYPELDTSDGSLIDAVRMYRAYTPIDIKSRRRFDRATWALIMEVSYDTVDEVNVLSALDLRALFRTADGV